jgi:hypothetical protein
MFDVLQSLRKILSHGTDYVLLDSHLSKAMTEAVKPESFTIVEVGGKRYLTVRAAKSIAQHIIFPGGESKLEDPWAHGARAQLIRNVEDMYARGYFDVCVIDRGISAFKLQTPPSVKKALQNLGQIHCIHFDKMAPEVYESIPRYITHVFTEGRVPLDAVVREGEFTDVDARATPSLADELLGLASDALAALESGTIDPETLAALRARQGQAIARAAESVF